MPELRPNCPGRSASSEYLLVDGSSDIRVVQEQARPGIGEWSGAELILCPCRCKELTLHVHLETGPVRCRQRRPEHPPLVRVMNSVGEGKLAKTDKNNIPVTLPNAPIHAVIAPFVPHSGEFTAFYCRAKRLPQAC